MGDPFASHLRLSVHLWFEDFQLAEQGGTPSAGKMPAFRDRLEACPPSA